MSLRTHVRLVGAVALLMLALGGALTGMMAGQHRPREGQPHGLSSPVLAMELVSTVAQVNAVTGDLGDPRRAALETNTRLDFAFIGAYGALFVVVGLLLARTARPGRRAAALLAVALGVGAAALDVAENVGILRVLSVRLADLDPEALAAIHRPAYAKWALCFAVIGLVARSLGWKGRGAAVRALVGLFFASSAVGLAGLLSPRLFEPGLALMSVGVLILAAVALLRPDALLPAAASVSGGARRT